MKTTTSQPTIKTGLVEEEYGILSVTNLNVEDIIIQDRSVIKVDEGTNLGIKGGVIEGYLGSNNGQLTVSSTFIDCKVSNTDGLGGSIYIKISDDLLYMFDLNGTSYSGCDAKFGKSLFIEAYNLRTAVPLHTEYSLTKTKIGAGNDEYEKVNLDNLIGYDGADTLTISLYYVYSDIDSQIYHVFNQDSTPNGNDNQFCGHLQWPCLIIDYVITLTGEQTLKKIGIVDGFKLNESVGLTKTGNQYLKVANVIQKFHHTKKDLLELVEQ
ncbi:MAG: hypothetical protein EZS28_015772 [Streblomastix strix]|uniref:Uncharacterized protein n=1 Tax=Streblomastix strix TaxID=222440 RepID=A0A5J4W1Y5_9EUKA|nr:MAG: hypothetical protein EZS28_015772 [Streblomastix strix]